MVNDREKWEGYEKEIKAFNEDYHNFVDTYEEERKKKTKLMFFSLLTNIMFIIVGMAITGLLLIHHVNINDGLGPSHQILDVEYNKTTITITLSNNGDDVFVHDSEGVSMYPTLSSNSSNLFVVSNFTDLKKGDIIAYNHGDYAILHRIIKTGYDADGKYYLTKGDNNWFGDGDRVHEKDYIGKLIGVFY